MKKLIEQVMMENEGVHKYSSTQVQVPQDIAVEVLRFSLEIPDEDIYTEEDNASYGRELDSHVTIKYGLVASEPEEIIKLSKGIQPFEVELREVAIFEAKEGGNGFDVLKIDVESEELRELNKKFSTLLNVDKHPEYMPHMTIAYLKAGKGKKYAGSGQFTGKKFMADYFYFKGSKGVSTKVELK